MIGLAIAGATAFFLGDDLFVGRTTHAVATLTVYLAWAALWYATHQRRLAGNVLEQGESDGSTDQPLLDRLDRIAAALERKPSAMIAGPLDADRSPFASTGIEKPSTPAIEGAVDRLLGELKAAQSVSDPARVLELRDQLAASIPADSLKEVDSQLAKWFMQLVMKRLRTGSIQPDLAALVGQIAERFGQTVEGASLRASLPTLRRSAGLCARCARPYRGIADACPVCLMPAPSEPVDAGDEFAIDETGESARTEEFPFIDPLEPL